MIFLHTRELRESHEAVNTSRDSSSPLCKKKKNQEKLLGCVVAINAKVIYRFEVRVFEEILYNWCVRRDFVIGAFCLPQRKNMYPSVFFLIFPTKMS